MAIGDPYVSVAELKSYMGIPAEELSKDNELTAALKSASREINRHCERQFGKADTATARLFKPEDSCCIEVDDFYSTTGLVLETDPSGSGNFTQPWTAADYELGPDPNGIVDGEEGYPFWEFAAVRGLRFPCPYPGRRQYTVRVTALWGWAEIPDDIKQACFQMATKNFSMAGAPLGVAGFGEFGVVRVRDIVGLEAKLCRYQRDGVHVG